MSRFGDGSVIVGKAASDDVKRYALPATAVAAGGYMAGTAIHPPVKSLKRAATAGLRTADNNMSDAVRRAGLPYKTRFERKKAQSAVPLAERGLQVAAARYAATQRAMPKLLGRASRLKRGGIGGLLVAGGTAEGYRKFRQSRSGLA